MTVIFTVIACVAVIFFLCIIHESLLRIEKLLTALLISQDKDVRVTWKQSGVE
jgi:hypothetical protein